jgi:hypothetical protein
MAKVASCEGFGIVQLGQVKSYARWFSLDGDLQLTFDTRSLPLQDQTELQSYQESSQPLPVQIPGDSKPSQGVVVGFQHLGRSVKFYVSRRVRKKAPPDGEAEVKQLGRIPK